MVDTLHFRLHDLARHRSILEALENKAFSNGSHHLKFEKLVNLKILTGDPKIDFSDAYFTYIRNSENGKENEKKIYGRGKFNVDFNSLKSNHYSIAYKIDEKGDFIDFNLSIPKYLYGNNIQMFIDHSLKNRHLSVFQTMKDALSKSYAATMRFIGFFFKQEFKSLSSESGLFWDETCLEIVRVDFCYNQFFSSKAEALQYLNDVKPIAKKFLRQTSQHTVFQTSISWVTDAYSFKIYHKGTEYDQVGDKRRHIGFNKQYWSKRPDLDSFVTGFDEHGRPVTQRRSKNALDGVFDVNFFQKVSDKILRYEMTFRNAYMDYIYKNRDISKKYNIPFYAYLDKPEHHNHLDFKIAIFRFACPHWQKMYNFYLKNRAKLDSKELFPIKTKYGFKKNDLTGKIIKVPWVISVSKETQLTMRYVEMILNRRFHFYFSASESFNYKTDMVEFKRVLDGDLEEKYVVKPGNARFTQKLWDEMAAEFLTQCMQFDLKRKIEYRDMVERVNLHNKNQNYMKKLLSPDQKVSKIKLPKTYNLRVMRNVLRLLETNTLKEIWEAGHLGSKSNYYEMRKKLKVLGITERNNATQHYTANWGFQEYYDTYFLNESKFLNNFLNFY